MLFLPSMQASHTLFGPVEINVPVPVSGNPYDATENDIRVVLTSPSKKKFERLAYYKNGSYYATIALPEKGSFNVQVSHNGKPLNLKLPNVTLSSQLKPFVTIRNKQFKIGQNDYWPVGHNMGWQSPQIKDITKQFEDMRTNGLTWSRVWASAWDGKNPYWMEGKSLPKDGWMKEEAFNRWEDLISSAERNNIRIQFVFFHHGQFSTQVNPNWQDHPWNKAKGGFLDKAEDFFTNLEAQRRTRNFLRYVVSRWGNSPAIMSWELFNEVQFTDMARLKNDWARIGKWHDDMADYIRSVDPNKRLITTSSELHAPIWTKMDYIQGHGYPPSVEGMILGTPYDAKKPLFYGEVGPADFSDMAGHQRSIREGIWAGFFAGHAGAGQYWFWDYMYRPNMYSEFKISTDILKTLGSPYAYKPALIEIKSEVGGDLTFTPGRGWEPTTLMEFQLPEDASPARSGQVSGYLQGNSNRKLQPKPLTFSFTARHPGVFKVLPTQTSKGGSHVVIKLNGKVVAEKKFAASATDTRLDSPIEAPFETGPQTIVVENIGEDWINVSRYQVTGIAPAVTGIASRSDSKIVFHLKSKRTGESVSLSRLAIPDGIYKVTEHDLSTGNASVAQATVSSGTLRTRLVSKDAVLVIELKE